MRALSLQLAILIALCAPAAADPPPAPAPPAAHTVIVPRETLDTLVAEAMLAQDLQRQLLQCQADVATLARRDEPEPRWWTAAKWGGAGALVIGAFALGVWVGH